jgi:hypothetical protein
LDTRSIPVSKEKRGVRCGRQAGYPIERLDGTLTVGIRDGYLVCPWLMPGPLPGVAEFALKLQEQTGCVLAVVGSAVVDRETLLSQSYPDRAPRGGPDGPSASGARGR